MCIRTTSVSLIKYFLPSSHISHFLIWTSLTTIYTERDDFTCNLLSCAFLHALFFFSHACFLSSDALTSMLLHSCTRILWLFSCKHLHTISLSHLQLNCFGEEREKRFSQCNEYGWCAGQIHQAGHLNFGQVNQHPKRGLTIGQRREIRAVTAGQTIYMN